MKRYLVPLFLLLSIATVSCQTLNQQHVGMYDALLHGATCDSNTLNAAIAAAASLNKQLIVSPTDRLNVACDWDISSAVSVPATRHLYIAPGAMLTKVGAGTLTMDSCPIAGRYQIFNNFSTGLTLRCEKAYPEWWGTGPTTFQDASDAMTVNGGTLDLGHGTYTQNGVIMRSKIKIKGKGVGITKAVLANGQHTAMFSGPSSSADVSEDMVTDCVIEDFEIDGNAANNGSGQSGMGIISPRGWTRCIVRNMYIHDTYSDAIGTLIRTKDSLFENNYMERNGRCCFGITGGSLRGTFKNNTCISPFNSCWDMEPANNVSALYDADYSYNLVDGLTCITPTSNGVSATWGNAIAAGFTGTRIYNRFENIIIHQPAGHGFIVADLHSTVANNIVVHTPGTGYPMWIGGYSSLGAIGVAVSNCTIRGAPSGVFGLFISDGDAGAVSDISVSNCAISGSITADVRVDSIPRVTLSGISAANVVSFGGNAQPISVVTHGQGPAVASVNTLQPLGLYSSYIVTGTTQINEITTTALWHGRVLTLTFDNTLVVAHNLESTETPIYLTNEANRTFCAGDTLTLRMTDETAGETRLQEIGHTKALANITYTTGGTPPISCARNITLAYTVGENITDFTNGDSNTNYTFNCTAGNAVIKDTSGGGNFQLAGNTDFTCTTSDTITLKKPSGLNMWHEVSRSVN